MENISANEYRGYFIHEFAKLEDAINYYLASYFVGKGEIQNDLISILIDRIPFENKRTALKAQLDFKHPKINGKHSSNYKKTLEDIGKLARLRNQFAHYHSVNYQSPGLAIALFEFRDDPKMIPFTIDYFNSKIELIKKCAETINKLRIEDNYNM